LAGTAQKTLDQGMARVTFLLELLKSQATEAEQGRFRRSEKDKTPEEEKNQVKSQRGVHLQRFNSFSLAGCGLSTLYEN
jgi:hypothetical protein